MFASKVVLSFTTVFILASTSGAQSIPNIPSCALPCFETALTSDGCDSLTDFKCHCTKTSLTNDIASCVEKDCSQSDQLAVAKTVQSTCDSVGEPVSIPTPSASAGSSSTAAGPTSSTTSRSASSSSTAIPAPSGVGSGGSCCGAPVISSVTPSTATNGSSTNGTVPFMGAAPQLRASALSGALAVGFAVVLAL